MNKNINKLIEKINIQHEKDLNRNYTKARPNKNLKPWQVTGYTDSEGSFICTIIKTGTGKTGFKVSLEYKVTQKDHSEGILIELYNYFNCGSIIIDNRKSGTKKYRVVSLSDILNKIIPHFENYPCITSKFLNYTEFKLIAELMAEKKHLEKEGMSKIINLASKMNTLRPFEEKFNFLKIGFTHEIINNLKNLPLEWVQTFLDGDSMFYNYVQYNNNQSLAILKCDSSLEISQSSHDVIVLLAIKNFFNGGYIKPKYNYLDMLESKNSRSVNNYILRDTDLIINFVDKYPMMTRKQLDYISWKKIVNIKKIGAHNWRCFFNTKLIIWNEL